MKINRKINLTKNRMKLFRIHVRASLIYRFQNGEKLFCVIPLVFIVTNNIRFPSRSCHSSLMKIFRRVETALIVRHSKQKYR